MMQNLLSCSEEDFDAYFDEYDNLRDAINSGSRIIVTTLQKFPVIYSEVDSTAGKNFAVIVDEAH